jgi:septum formation protein
MKLFLGSKSPRRSQLLSEMGIEFEVLVKETDESYPSDLLPHEVALHIASEKAKVLQGDLVENEYVLTADTIVCVDEQILGKPKDEQQAKEMLRMLSGREHEVITAVCLASNQKIKSDYCSTKVTVKPLKEEEIDYYIHRFQPFDKAGSYGIQEWFGAVAITQISGSYNNVVGLPTHLVYSLLEGVF